MTRYLAALLCLTACGASVDVELEFAPYGGFAPAPPTEGPPELLSALETAISDWADAGVEAYHIDRVGYLPQGELNTTCGYSDGTPLLGCSLGPSLWLREGMAGHALLAEVMRHELGHSIRRASGGSPGHLHCDAEPGDDLMCNKGSLTFEITPRDVAFVGGAL